MSKKQSCSCTSCTNIKIKTENVSEDLPEIKSTTWSTGNAELKDHIRARLGMDRMNHLLAPILYSLGKPTSASPVVVTANYTLSFDALRSALKGTDCYILVLDTKGVNVWCAAGKGTFGTDELINRIKATKLEQVVTHRNLIVPQLGASGVNAFEVEKRSGFKVNYGPIRANDISEYLKTGTVTPEMRQVKYPLKDRMVLIPVELKATALRFIAAVAILYLIGGAYPAAAAAVSILSGTALFAIVLPWLPTRDFSSKGFILGILVALPFVATSLVGYPETALWIRSISALAYVLLMSPVTAYLALNFTGSTTFTSRSGVKREIFRYIPVMASSLIAGTVLAIILVVSQYVLVVT